MRGLLLRRFAFWKTPFMVSFTGMIQKGPFIHSFLLSGWNSLNLALRGVLAGLCEQARQRIRGIENNAEVRTG